MRLITRPNFDGLVCGVLLAEVGMVQEYKFVHPRDILSGGIKITPRDILADISFVQGCGFWFDHHESEENRIAVGVIRFRGQCHSAPSAAQIIWDYFGGVEAFGERYLPLLEAVNKSDSGNLSMEDIEHPEGYILLSFIVDPHTGLERFNDYRISYDKLMSDLTQYCRTMTLEEILDVPDVKARIDRYHEHEQSHRDMLLKCSQTDDNVIITNLLDEKHIYCGNRFAIYTLYPEQNIEVRLMAGKIDDTISISCGHSILNRTSNTNVSDLMLQYRGGGHKKVGACQIPIDRWEYKFKDIVRKMKIDG
jgi:oligoribonuclease NrnB/cAMP/cGMP phosphodiesterase (DHH superfamily)